MQKANIDDIFFNDIFFTIMDREAQFVFRSDASMGDKLLVFLARHGKMLQAHADIFDAGSPRVARVRLSEFAKKGYTKSRNIDVAGYSKTGVSAKGKKTTVHLMTKKGLAKAIDILKKLFPQFLSSPGSEETLIDLKRIGLSEEDFWSDSRVPEIMSVNLDTMKRSMRLHELTAKVSYAAMLMCVKGAMLSSFSIEQRYDYSGDCLVRSMSVRPSELAQLCRTDIYYRFEAEKAAGGASVDVEYLFEHDMCSEKVEDIKKKFEQYDHCVFAPRLSNCKSLPVMLFSISTMLADKCRISASKEGVDTFTRSSTNRIFADMGEIIAHLVAEKLSDDSQDVEIDSPIMRLGIVRRLVGLYGESQYVDFLQHCIELWGEDVPFVSLRDRFSGKKTTEPVDKSKRLPCNFALIKRRREVYNLLLDDDDFKTYFRSGLSVFCTDVSRIHGATMGNVICNSFSAAIAKLCKSDDIKPSPTVTYYRGGRNFGLDKGGGKLKFMNLYECSSSDLPFVVENISSDVGALFRAKELTDFPSASLPFVPIYLYNKQDITDMDYSHRNIIKAFLRYAHASRIPVYSCEYTINGASIICGDILKDNNELFALIK